MMPAPADRPDLVWAGKPIEAMTREELVAALEHFRSAHIRTTEQMAAIIRRMAKTELALTKEQLECRDWWLRKHPQDIQKGDGTDRHLPWTEFQPDGKGGFIERTTKRGDGSNGLRARVCEGAMTRRPSAFLQSDVRCAVKAVVAVRPVAPADLDSPFFLRRWDQCCQPSWIAEPLAPWHWIDRQVLLHARCEVSWHKSEVA